MKAFSYLYFVNNRIIIAHRGESFDAPENTLAAINLAYEKGADAVEIDIRLTKDNQIVVIHDANTRRVSRKVKWISKTNLVDLKKLDVGKFKDSEFVGERIPTLQEILYTVPNGKKILIEIKSDSKIIPYLKNAIDESNLQRDQIVIISFKLDTLISVKKQLTQYSVFWVCELDYYWIRNVFRPSINRIIAKACKYKIDGLDLWAGAMLDSHTVKKIKLRNLKLYVWTVNRPEQAKLLFNWGVDGITTDRTEWIKKQLESK